MQGWGKTVILGVEMHGCPLSIDARELLYGKSIIGSVFGGTKPKEDIPILAKKYLDKVILLFNLIVLTYLQFFIILFYYYFFKC